VINFHEDNFVGFCTILAKKDRAIKTIIRQHGHPPVWTRSNTFASLIHIILEQQVSLASAKAAFVKLKNHIGAITPQKIMQLSDAELRACYFSRQKTVYARELAQAIILKKLNLKKLSLLPDDEVRQELKRIKGIGDWTVDIYLLFVLQRCDVFPTGDLAMMNALKEVKKISKQTSKEEIIELAEHWRPYRSIATYLLWHHYIKTRNILL